VNATEFRAFFDGAPASKDDLDRFETITVEQEVDRSWRARFELPICVGEGGTWSGEDAEFMEAFRSVRLEIKVGRGSFEPLIDGPVAAIDTQRSSSPGRSSATMIVADDGVLLNQEGDHEVYPPGLSDSDIASRIFAEYSGKITSTMIESTPADSDVLPQEVVRNGTHMQLLRRLARRNDLHVAVLPGADPGSSIGVFHSLNLFDEELPELILLGADRNIDSFNGKFDGQQHTNFKASTLSFNDKAVVTRQSRLANLDLLGDKPAFESDNEVGMERLRPASGEDRDLQHRVDREARRRSRAYEATGSVRSGSYSGVLRPFYSITARLGATEESGSFLVKRVTHRLTRSEYTQEFALVTDARSATGGANAGPGGLF
jgi:hypothetical protein